MKWFDVVSVCGSFITLVGFILTLKQLRDVKQIADKTQRELSRIDTLVDITKCNEIIKDISLYLKNQRIDHALSKLREAKDMIVKFKVYMKKLNDDNKLSSSLLVKMDSHLDELQGSINDIEEHYSNPNSLNIAVLCRKFDELSSFIVEVQANISTINN